MLAQSIVLGLGLTFLVATAQCQTSSASFIRADTTSQGNWTGRYGNDGYQIANDSNGSLPSYASFSVSASGGAGTYTWSSSTTDPRALQVSSGSTSRIASTWFTTSSQIMTVSLNDNNTHRIALYFLDWSDNSRTQTVQITDAATNTVLDTETLTNFNNGTWLSWNISGNVNIIIDCTTTGSGENPLVSGIFFDPSPTASAVFLQTDTATQGNWTNVYGGDGYQIANDSNGSLPSYASFNVSASGGAGTYTWTNSTTDPRAPQVSSGSSSRIASTWFTTSSQIMTVSLSDGNTHEVALYFLDWSDTGRVQTVQITDAATNAPLDFETLNNFDNGTWLVWNISGNVNISIDCVTTGSGENPLVSGIFFGGASSSSSGPSSYTLSGQVTFNGAGLAGATLTLSGSSSGTFTTGSDGNYSFTVQANGSYQITPSLANYTFSPNSLSATSVTSSQSSLNFSAYSSGGSLSPSSPTKEFLYLGGRAVAIEERGSGTQANTVGATHRPAGVTAAASPGSASAASASTTNNAPPPTLPTAGTPPRNNSGTAAPLPVATPASTHTTAH